MFFAQEPEEPSQNENFVNWNFDVDELESTPNQEANPQIESKPENQTKSNGKTLDKFKDMFSDSEA